MFEDEGRVLLEFLVPKGVSAEALGRFIEGAGLAYRRALRLAENEDLLAAAQDGPVAIQQLLDRLEPNHGWLIRPRRDSDRLHLVGMGLDSQSGLLVLRFSSIDLAKHEKAVEILRLVIVLLALTLSTHDQAAEVGDLVSLGSQGSSTTGKIVQEHEATINVTHNPPGGSRREPDRRVPANRQVSCADKENEGRKSGVMVRAAPQKQPTNR